MASDEFRVYTVKDKSVLDDDSGDEIDDINQAGTSANTGNSDDSNQVYFANRNAAFPTYKVASDYMNDEEIEKATQFKKPKKRLKKDRIRRPLSEADDSVAKKPRISVDEKPEEGELVDEPYDARLDNFEDDLEKEMRAELERAIKLKQKHQKPECTNYTERSNESSSDENEDEKDENTGIYFDATAEYCRNLSHIAAENLNLNILQNQPTTSHTDEFEIKQEIIEDEDVEEDMEIDKGTGKWSEVNVDEERKKVTRPNLKLIKISKSSRDVSHETATEMNNPILEEEPDLRRSVANALRYAIQKGYLEKETKKLAGAKTSSRSAKYLQAQSYTIEEKFSDPDDKRARGRNNSGRNHQFQPVKMPDNFNPDAIQIKLEYTDDTGRELNTKEAFRYLSHKFHGKGPGLNKQEKRLKKQEREASIKQMSSTDTPLGTVSLMVQKQKELQQPYLELNGL